MSRVDYSVLPQDVQQAQVSVELQKPAAVGQTADVDRGEAEGLDEGCEVRIERDVVAGCGARGSPLSTTRTTWAGSPDRS
jgi:hypothetical protein